MKIIFKPKFRRDTEKISNIELLLALQEKINQVKKAEDITHITGLKLLRAYTNHYRIIVKTEKESYRIGAIIRGTKIWLVRFLPRKTVYQKFP